MHLFLLYIGFIFVFSSIANQRGKNNRKRRIKKAYIKGKEPLGKWLSVKRRVCILCLFIILFFEDIFIISCQYESDVAEI